MVRTKTIKRRFVVKCYAALLKKGIMATPLKEF